ncbi:MAG: phage tail protein, partial [Gallionellaceae bacterium]
MSFGNKTINNEEPRVLSLRVNQSAYGGAKTRVWGKCRVPGNLLDYMDFTSTPHTTSETSGGKGGGGVTSTNTSYTYTAATIIGLCTGTIAGVGKVWRDKDTTTLDALGMTLKTGALRQAVWSHLTANHPDQAVTYSGIAFVANNAFDLGSSPNSPNLSFEVFGERIISGGDDAAAADIIYDIVADPVEGIGLSADVLANINDYALWCTAMGLSVSVGATSQHTSRDLIAQVLKATMAEAVWSAGQIRIVPYGDEAVGAWTPNTTPVYDLTESDFLEAPRHKRTQPADAINRVTLNYTSRAKDYNTVTVMRDDLSAVTQFGPRPETLDLACITRDAMAVVVCEFWRNRGLYIRNQWEFVVDERYCLVEAMDLLTLTFGPQHLDHVAVRVVETTDDGAGKISMLVEEWPFGLLKATAIPTQPISGYVPEQNIAPGATNTPVIFEAPNYLTAPALEIWIGASGGAHWGGANVWVSDDGMSYQQIGAITNPARHGVLAAALAAGSDPDTTHTLYADMTLSGGQLLSGTQADADNGNTLCWVDGELIAYQTATLTTPNHYSLAYLRRGQQGTISAGHASGAQFLRLNDAVFKYRVPSERIGSPVWIKLQAFNKFGRSPEPLDTVTAHQYTIAGNKPLPLTSLTATGGLFEIGLAWTTSPSARDIDYIELWAATSNNRANAYPLTSQKHPLTAWKHPGLQPAQSWYYWGRAVDTSGNAGDYYPSSATAGIYASVSSDPSALLTQLQSSIDLSELSSSLAIPLAGMPGALKSHAIVSLQESLSTYDITNRMQWQEAVTNATISTDPLSGKIQLLATANVTTDVESRLTSVETVANAATGTLTSTVATVATQGANLTTAQGQIATLANQVSLSASQVYVDESVNNATGAITVGAANSASALAQAEIQSALDAFTSAGSLTALTANVATAQSQLTSTAEALQSEVIARSALVATVAANGAAILSEQTARADADTANATSISALSAQVNNATTGLPAAHSAIQSEQTARADADTANATSISALSAQVNNATTGLPAAHSAIQSEQT